MYTYNPYHVCITMCHRFLRLAKLYTEYDLHFALTYSMHEDLRMGKYRTVFLHLLLIYVTSRVGSYMHDDDCANMRRNGRQNTPFRIDAIVECFALYCRLTLIWQVLTVSDVASGDWIKAKVEICKEFEMYLKISIEIFRTSQWMSDLL